jgi:hypothetical protein
MAEDPHLAQKRLLLLLQRGAWPYYAAIIALVLLVWLFEMF